MDERLEGLFYCLHCSIEGPDICFEAKASLNVDFIFIVKKNHSFSDVATGIAKPFFARLVQVDQNGADLPSFDRSNWDSVTVQALYFDNTEGPFAIRTKQSPLVLPELALMHNSS